ncbi:hypothetical protein R3P38DRAFT_2986489 [Favolaschia claudopus]|uniref:GATA-type domain-containing protein n=1 Tax=Favolaschia claudopus TaxID=2862362 RepID=A0AAW0AVR6_9AGAR
MAGDDPLFTKTADYLEDLHAKYEEEKAFYEKKYQKIQNRANRRAKGKGQKKSTQMEIASSAESRESPDSKDEDGEIDLANARNGSKYRADGSRSSADLGRPRRVECHSTLTRVLRSRPEQIAVPNGCVNTLERSMSPLSSVPSSPAPDSPFDRTSIRTCTNCHTHRRLYGRSSLEPGRLRCQACLEYERRNGKLRPLALEALRPLLAPARKYGHKKRMVALAKPQHSETIYENCYNQCDDPTNYRHHYPSRLRQGEWFLGLAGISSE